MPTLAQPGGGRTGRRLIADVASGDWIPDSDNGLALMRADTEWTEVTDGPFPGLFPAIWLLKHWNRHVVVPPEPGRTMDDAGPGERPLKSFQLERLCCTAEARTDCKSMTRRTALLFTHVAAGYATDKVFPAAPRIHDLLQQTAAMARAAVQLEEGGDNDGARMAWERIFAMRTPPSNPILLVDLSILHATHLTIERACVERDAAVHHVKVFPLSPDLIGATPAPDYPYAEWEACVNATARLEAGLIHGALEQVIVGTTHTALSAVLYAGMRLRFLAQLALPLVMVVREPGPQGDVMPWAVARQLSPISAPPPIIPAFRWREVYGMSPRGAPRTLLFAATTFTLVSHGDAASARSALRDPDAIIVQIEPVDPNTRVQATEQNVVGIARAMWTEVQRALLLMPDGLHVAVAFAGPAPLAFLFGQCFQSSNVFGDVTVLEYRNRAYEVMHKGK